MNYYEVKVLNPWYFVIKLPFGDRIRFQFKQKTMTYNWALKRYISSIVDEYLYEELDDLAGEFTFQTGYAGLILKEYVNELPQSTKKILEGLTYKDVSETLELPGLYDFQVEDLKSLLSRRRGILQTYTSYGKSESIVALVRYFLDTTSSNILIVTPSGAALDELWIRLKIRLGLELDYIDYSSRVNLINVNGFLRSNSYDPSHEYWKSDFIILADEVENCIPETAMEFYETLPRVSRMYGFSATPDKKKASQLTFDLIPNPEVFFQDENSMKISRNEVLGRNKWLVGYFGEAGSFRRPSGFTVKMIRVQTTLTTDDFEVKSDYEYSEVIYELFTNKHMCNLIEKVVYNIGTVFIPMFRLQVIDHWLENIFKRDEFLTVVISSRGYEVYIGGKYHSTVSLEVLKKLTRDGTIGVILGTKSSYNALDLPELKRCILLYSQAANVVLQAIGRTARGKEFEIYSLVPYKNIKFYSRDLESRLSLIEEYYSECDILKTTKYDHNFV